MTDDRYAVAYRFLKAHPEQITDAWSRPSTHVAGCLFQFCTPSGGVELRPFDGRICGCATQVKREGCFSYVAWTHELTAHIRGLDLPSNPDSLTVDHLWTLVELQRHMDATIRSESWMKKNRRRLKNQEKTPDVESEDKA